MCVSTRGVFVVSVCLCLRKFVCTYTSKYDLCACVRVLLCNRENIRLSDGDTDPTGTDGAATGEAAATQANQSTQTSQVTKKQHVHKASNCHTHVGFVGLTAPQYISRGHWQKTQLPAEAKVPAAHYPAAGAVHTGTRGTWAAAALLHVRIGWSVIPPHHIG